MKFKLISAYVVLFLLALSLQAGKTVNSRKVPTANDFLSEGAGPRYANQESLNVELANILTSTKDRDAIDVDRVITDTVSSNPVIDSTQGALVIASGAGGVDIDTIIGCEQIVSADAGVDIDTIKGCDLATIASIAGGTDFADSMSIGSGDEISKVSVAADSVQFIIGDSTYSIAVTNTYVTP